MPADPDPVQDRDAALQPQWRVTALVDSRLEAELVVRLLRGHGVDAQAVLHRDGTADILVPETAAEAARRALGVV